MASFTVGDYLAETRPKLVFGILSSYRGTTTHPSRQAEAHRSLSGIGCTNEHNCSFAAEGYARAEGGLEFRIALDLSRMAHEALNQHA
jgi:pyruvate decarboxylase